MNDSISSDILLAEYCLQQFRSITELEGTISASPTADASIALQFPQISITYDAQVKPRVDRISMLERLKASHPAHDTLLITRNLSPELASHSRRLGLQFIDSAGNAYLDDRKGVFLFISGQKAAIELPAQTGPSSITPAGLRVIFAFLAKPALLNAPYREIALAAKVSLGLIGPVLSQLTTRGFLGVDGAGKRALLHRRQLTMEWAAGYLGQLRPKLDKHRFTVADPGALSEWMERPGLTWSGEPAAACLTKYLRPEMFTLYADMRAPVVAAMAAKLRLRPDPAGKLEIIDRFWNPDVLDVGHLAPPELVYADLLAMPDTRNQQTADLILNTLIEHAEGTR